MNLLPLVVSGVLALWLLLFGLFPSLPQPQSYHSVPLHHHSHPQTVIFVVLDAFRFDYAAKFPFFTNLLSQYPRHSLLLKMLSSAPTMTTQKIQVMMSGHQLSSKSLIDTFMARPASDDNLINKVSAISLGDDTWSKLYPFKKSLNCNSFNVADLHSCDKVVMDNLVKEYKKREYQMLVGHFLGLDHIGHTFSSVSTVQMDNKLTEISRFLEGVVKEMDQETMLVVVGDHGMKQDGNHGGGSKEEIETVLFTYSKHRLMDEPPQEVCSQRDIASTLSIILNVSVPINSLGNIIASSIPSDLNIDINKATQQLRNHTGSVLSRLGVKYDKGEQLEVGQQLKISVNHGSILVVAVVLASAIAYTIWKLKLSILDMAVIAIYPITNFSWLLLRHQQTYLQLLLILVFLGLTIKSQQPSVFINSIGTLFLLCQFEPSRNDEFENSFLHLDFVSKYLQNRFIILICKLLVFVYLTNFRQLAPYQSINKVLVLASIFLTQVNEELLCTVKALQLVYLFATLATRNNSDQQIIHSIILIFSGKKGILMFALSDILKPNLPLSGTFQPYINYLIAETVWLAKGNRADFSTIDIKASYALSTQFNPLLNFICLVVNQMCSYLHFIKEIPLQNKKFYVLSEHESEKEARTKITGVNAHTKYLLIPFVSMLFALMGLYLNIDKILFTVVYAPLAFFCTMKAVALLSILGLRVVGTKTFFQKGQ